MWLQHDNGDDIIALCRERITPRGGVLRCFCVLPVEVDMWGACCCVGQLVREHGSPICMGEERQQTLTVRQRSVYNAIYKNDAQRVPSLTGS